MNISNDKKISLLETECEELKKQLLQKTVVLHVINDVIHEISQEVDLKTILDKVAINAKQLIQADSLLIPILNDEQTKYTYMAATGKNSENIINQTFPKKTGMCGWVLTNEEVLYFGKNSTHLMGKETSWEEGMDSALLVPLKSRGKIVGGLSGIGKKNGKSFTRDDKNVLQLFADHISIAIENAFIFNQLNLEKERLETTLKSIGDGVITTNNKGQITSMNPIAEKLTGWKEQDAIDFPLSDVFKIFNYDTKLPAQNPVEKAMKTGDIVGIGNHTVLIARNGTEYQIADSAAPIKDNNNTIQGVILVFRDISEETALQNELKTNQEQLQSILDNTPAVIYIKDFKGQYLLINKQFEKLFNVTNKQDKNFTDYDIFPSQVADQLRKNDLDVLNGADYIEVEENVPLEDGIHNYIAVKFPLLDANNRAYAVCGISTDITEHRKTEEALRRAQKMDAIGQLSGGIAHDFNNQLGIVIGYLDMLGKNLDLNEMQQKWLTTASTATERCMDLTRQLLSFSSKKTKQTGNINVNDSIEEMKTVISRSLTPQIDIIYNLDSDIWLTNIDNGELQDALLNIIINAKDAMPTAGVLEIRTENIQLDNEQLNLVPGSRTDHYIRISIQDNGTGMLAESLERIFEPFYTTKPTGKGTGLGMAMVYGFTKRHEGFVKIYSELGLGTNINLYLPQSEKNTIIEDKKISSTVSISPGGKETILIVDDETDLLHLAELYLEDLGYNTLLAKDAAKALQILEHEEHIDLLFTDVVMPGGMNGYELATKATELYPRLKVIITSGFTSRNIQDTRLVNFSGTLLNKPYRKDQLAKRIRNTLDNKE